VKMTDRRERSPGVWSAAAGDSAFVSLLGAAGAAPRKEALASLDAAEFPLAKATETARRLSEDSGVLGSQVIIETGSRAALPLEGRDLTARRLKDGIKVRIRRLDQHAMLVVT